MAREARSRRRNTERSPRPGASKRPNFVSYHASRQNAATTQSSKRQATSIARPALHASLKSRPLYVAASVVVCLVLLYSLTLSSNSSFIMTNPSGVPLLRSNEAYQEATNNILSGSIFNRTKLTVDTAKLSKELQAEFPELETVEVVLPFVGRQPIVEAVTARPVLQLATADGAYFVTSKGRAVMRVERATPAARKLGLPVVQDQADLDVTEGKGVLSSQDVTFITTLVEQFKSRKLTVTAMELPPLASELHVRVSGKPYVIKFSLLTDARVAVGQYFALDAKLVKDSITPKEYIDSRVEGKIYYR